MAKPPVFAREATGLVREVGAWPSFMATVGLVTGGVPVLYVATMYTAPGANWPLAFLIALFPTFLMAGLFTIVGISMPRSGGDYVFTTRGLNPYLGFMNYWGIGLGFIFTAGVFLFFAGTYPGYFLSGLGAFDGNAGLTSFGTYLVAPGPSSGVGVVILAASVLLAVVRPRVTWGAIFWGGIISLVFTVAMFVALAGSNQSSFASAYNSFIGNSTAYQGVLQTGGVTPPSSMMLATAAALPFAWFSYTWYNLPITWSGEMKNVKRSIPIAILVAISFIAAYYILWAILVSHAFGQAFLDNWSSLASSGSAPIPGIGGFVPFFALLVYHNPVLYCVMFLALWLPMLYGTPAFVISQTRYVFAWAFDRILPDRFASVNERFHTPILATLLVSFGMIVGMVLTAFLPGEFSTALYAIFTFGFIIPAIAAIVFPFRKKQIYETAFIAKKKFILPLISWLGLGSVIYLFFSCYLAYQSGSLPIDSFSMSLYAAIYGSGALMLIYSYLSNRRRGLSLDLVFKEIPPE